MFTGHKNWRQIYGFSSLIVTFALDFCVFLIFLLLVFGARFAAWRYDFCSLPREKLRPAQRAKKHARCDNCDNWTAVFAHHIGGRNIRGIRCIKYNYYYIYLFIYIFYLSSRPCEKIGCHLSQLSQDGTTRSTRPFLSEQETPSKSTRTFCFVKNRIFQ